MTPAVILFFLCFLKVYKKKCLFLKDIKKHSGYIGA